MDALVGGDAAEIDVQHVLAEVVPLHFDDLRLLGGAAFRLQIDDAGAVADGGEPTSSRDSETEIVSCLCP